MAENKWNRYCLFPCINDSKYINHYKEVVWDVVLKENSVRIAFGRDRKEIISVNAGRNPRFAGWTGESIKIESDNGKPVYIAAVDNCIVFQPAEKINFINNYKGFRKKAGRFKFFQTGLMESGTPKGRTSLGNKRNFSGKILESDKKLILGVSRWNLWWDMGSEKAEPLDKALRRLSAVDPEQIWKKAASELLRLPKLSLSKNVEALWNALDKNHRLSVYKPEGFIKNKWESIGRGKTYQRRIAGHYDTCHVAMDLVYSDPARAKEELENYFRTANAKNGMLPSDFDISGPNYLCSHPPVASIAAWQIYSLTGDKGFIKNAVKVLARNMDWWEGHADRDKDGLYEYMDSFGTGWESGNDKSPRWYDESGKILNRPLACIDLNCQMIISYKSIQKMAKVLGMKKLAGKYRGKEETLRALVRENLYDKEDNFFYDKHAGGFSRIKSIASYWALLAGIPDKSTAENMAAIFNDPRKFMGQIPGSFVAKDEKSYVQGAYWNGTVFVSQNLYLIKAFREYGFDDLAAKLAMRTVNTCGRIALERERIYEFYLPDNRLDLSKPWGDPENTISGPYYIGHMPARPIILEGLFGMKAENGKVSFNPAWKYLPKESSVEFVANGVRRKACFHKKSAAKGIVKLGKA